MIHLLGIRSALKLACHFQLSFFLSPSALAPKQKFFQTLQIQLVYHSDEIPRSEGGKNSLRFTAIFVCRKEKLFFIWNLRGKQTHENVSEIFILMNKLNWEATDIWWWIEPTRLLFLKKQLESTVWREVWKNSSIRPNVQCSLKKSIFNAIN